MNLKSIFAKQVLILEVLILSGCEGYIDYRGRVESIDNESRIDSAKVILYLDGHEWGSVYSDSNGNYSIGSGLVGCVPSCPDSRLSGEKDGYIFVKTERDGDSTKVLMKVEETD